MELAEARSERLVGDHSDWGSYYDAQPRVMFGDIAAGQAYLARAAETVAQEAADPAFAYGNAVAL